MISIIIVAWQVRDLLKRCLETILANEKNVNFEIIVIDNNSSDATEDLIKNNFPQLTYLKLNQNHGFAYACNLGAGIAKGDYLLFLNPDTWWTEPILEKVGNYYRNLKNPGALGIKILNPDKTIQPWVRKLPDLFSQIIILLKLQVISKKLLKNYLVLNFDYQENSPVEQIIGAFFFIKKDVFTAIGKFDDNFFIWFEEVDLCRRLLQAGYKNYYYQQAFINHQGEASFQQMENLKKQLIFNRSLLYYFKKNHNFLNYWLLLTIIPVNLLLTLIISLLKIKIRHYL